MTRILMHYMTWFAADRSDGYAYNHWKGQRNHSLDGVNRIASKLGLIGRPYASECSQTIQKHLDQIRKAGVHGIVIDWYGDGLDFESNSIYDYALIHDAALKTLKAIDQINGASRTPELEVALCFDCNCHGNLEKRKIDPTAYITRSLTNAAKQFVTSSGYLRHAGRPLLFLFGDPGAGVLQSVDWDEILTKVEVAWATRPLVVSQVWIEHQLAKRSEGVFGWLPLKESNELDVRKEWFKVEAELSHAYAEMRAQTRTIRVGAAFPGVRDAYLEDNRPSEHLEIIERDGGDTLRRTLLLGLSQGIDYLQIATFNDWGEGTQVEPSVEYGDRELMILSDTLRHFLNK